jgi:hypothetical protein
LDFAMISTHQQADICLQWIKQSNNNNETCIIGCTPIVYHHDKIVVPQSLQRQIVDWYHMMLAHPGETQAIKTIKNISIGIPCPAINSNSSKHVRPVNITNDNARTIDTYQPKFNTISNHGMKFMLTWLGHG